MDNKQNKKKSGYYWRVLRQLKQIGEPNYIYHTLIAIEIISYSVRVVDLAKFSFRKRNYIVRHAFDFRKIFFVWLLFAVSSFAFQGVGDCEKLLSDYAQLTNKSVFLPHALSGQCVIQNEKHIPLILKSAGYHYSEKSGYLSVRPIEPIQEKEKEPWKPQSKFYNVEFLFVNTSQAIDCGFTMDDIFFRLRNLDYSFSVGLALGCPALDYDGSFAFRVNAHLLETWTYSHGTESQRQKAQITSSTGAVTNEYDYITTGLNLTLTQTEKGVSFSLKYTGNNGSVTTASGGVVDEIKATTTDEFTRTRKFWAIPLGSQRIHANYTLILRITPLLPSP